MFFTHQHLRVALWAALVLGVSGRGCGGGCGGGDNRRRTPCFRCTDSCCSQCVAQGDCGRRRRVTCAGLSSYNAASKVSSTFCPKASGTYYSSKQAAGDACNANTACYGISLLQGYMSSNHICHPGCYGSWINNGQCDYSCNVASCNFDGGDCPPPWPYGSWYQCKAESTWQTYMADESYVYKKTGVPSCESQTTDCEWLQQEGRCVSTNSDTDSEDTTVPIWVVVLLILLGPKVCLPLFCCLLKKCLDAPDETTEQIRMEELQQPRAQAAASSAPPIATVTPIPPPGPRDTAADWAPDIAEMDIETVRNELEREDLDEGMANKLLARIADLQANQVAPGVVDEPTEERRSSEIRKAEEALKAYVASVVAEAFEMSDAQLDFEIRKASEAGDGNRVTGLKAVKSMRENNTHVAPADAKAKTDEEFVREWMMNMPEEKKSMVLSGCNWSKMSWTQRKKRLEDQSSRDTVRFISQRILEKVVTQKG